MCLLTPESVREGLRDPKLAPRMAKVLVRSGWLRDFRVFEELRQFQATEYGVGGTGRPPRLIGIKPGAAGSPCEQDDPRQKRHYKRPTQDDRHIRRIGFHPRPHGFLRG